MMRLTRLCAGLLLGLSSGAFAATREDYDACGQTQDAKRSIAACARIVSDAGEKAVDRAAAYVSLGNVYAVGGDLGRAIAMYSVAIETDPRNVYAFAARAIASDRMGNRARALADYQYGCRADAARFIALAAASNELEALGDAGSRCELPQEHGAIVIEYGGPGSDFGQVYVGMKFGAKTEDEAESQAKARCVAQCRQLSPSGACKCDIAFKFGPGYCGYVTIGVSPAAAAVVTQAFAGQGKEEVLEQCRKSAMALECEEPVGGCNK